MVLSRKVIFHLFSLFTSLKFGEDLITGIIILIVGLALAGFFVLIRVYIRSYISEIVSKELEKNPRCIEQIGKIENLIKKHGEIDNLINEIFPRKFVLQKDREDTIYGSKDIESIYDFNKPVVGYDEERGEVIFRIKLKDLISPDEMTEEGEKNGKGRRRC